LYINIFPKPYCLLFKQLSKLDKFDHEPILLYELLIDRLSALRTGAMPFVYEFSQASIADVVLFAADHKRRMDIVIIGGKADGTFGLELLAHRTAVVERI
jgi:hypothetical protein